MQHKARPRTSRHQHVWGATQHRSSRYQPAQHYDSTDGVAGVRLARQSVRSLNTHRYGHIKVKFIICPEQIQGHNIIERPTSSPWVCVVEMVVRRRLFKEKRDIKTYELPSNMKLEGARRHGASEFENTVKMLAKDLNDRFERLEDAALNQSLCASSR